MIRDMVRSAVLAAAVLAFPAGADTRGPGTMASHGLPALDCSESETFLERKNGERQTVVRCWTEDDAETEEWRNASRENAFRSLALTFADPDEAPLALTGCRITSMLTFGGGDDATVRIGLVCADGSS
jgi:hypothetical protein